MVEKNTNIELVAIKNEVDSKDYRSIYFKRPANFIFKSGDWIDIGFNDKKLTGGVTYSISSSPTESDIRITFREGISEFKTALRSIKADDRLFISQYGNDNDFRLMATQSSVLIAGGVGIAPFRSMIKEMYDNNGKNSVRLIYLNQSDDFLFKTELEVWAKYMPSFDVIYIRTKEINRKKREKIILSLIKNPNQSFYISGPPGMVDTNEHLLIGSGVHVRNIRIDSFGGY